MKKSHDLHSIIINHIEIRYFYIREKNDRNGNARYRVYIIDPETLTVYETLTTNYECCLSDYVRRFVEEATK